ncbi:iron-containing alcohol dehydrogenase [Candidatus Bathyarchaeota archaeon]|nr:iron-containing alcohol dehydrogenase [Candidatus Bathyarchaeota archaeon]
MSTEDFNPLHRIYLFQLPPRILFGVGSTRSAGTEIERFSCNNILLVIGPRINSLPLSQEIKETLEGIGAKITIYDKIPSEPTEDIAEDIAGFVRDNTFDLVVGFGGGSVLDMAKIASAMVANLGPIRQYLGGGKIKEKGLPMILIPTTAGTGSEVTYSSVVRIDGLKTTIKSSMMLADAAIVDPSLTLSLPPKTTASSGCDALSHAIECILSLNASPITDSLALQSVSLLTRCLRTAYSIGNNLEARVNVSLGSLLAGMAFPNSGNVIGHSIANSICQFQPKISHGEACSLALPYTMLFNLKPAQHKLFLVAKAIGLDVSGLSEYEGAVMAIEAVTGLMRDLDLPLSLRALGLDEASIETMVDNLVNKYPKRTNNPRCYNEENMLELYRAMLEGDLRSQK